MTYTIAYRSGTVWFNYVDQENDPIQFNKLDHARRVADDLMSYHENYPKKLTDFRIMDNWGKLYPICEGVEVKELY